MVIFGDLLFEEVAVELVAGFADGEATAVFEEDFYFLVVEVVGAVVELAGALEIGRSGHGERLTAEADGGEATVDEIVAEGGENLVVGVLPALDGHHNVVVVDLSKAVEEVGGGRVETEDRWVEFAGTPQDVQQQLVGGNDGLVHVYLPVHEAAGDDELLDGVDTFLVDDQLIVVDVEHRDDAIGADYALADTGEEAVATEIVEAVHVELAAHQLVEEMLVVGIGEYGNSHIQRPIHFLIDALHHHQGNLLVGDIDKHPLTGVGEGAVADVVQENGQFGTAAFLVGDAYTFLFQHLQGPPHEVEGAEHVAEAGVHGARVDEVGEPQLLDAALALEIRVFDNLQYHRVIDREKPVIDGVVDNLTLEHKNRMCGPTPGGAAH